NDEGQKIERKWNDPQQRNGGEIGGEVGRDAQHQARGHKRQQEPEAASTPGRGRFRFFSDMLLDLLVAGLSPQNPAADQDADSVERKTPAPAPGLLAKSPNRLKSDRIREQRQKAARVTC